MGLQDGWRWCSTCQVLVYAGFSDGVCWDGRPHTLDDSGAYSVHKDDVPAGLQPDWRWCSRCQVMVYSGFNEGICHDGQPHHLNDSGAYGLSMDEPAADGYQDGWRWCSRCQDLVYSGFNEGICHDGEPHHLNDSGAYNVAMAATDSLVRPPQATPAPQPDAPARPAIQISESNNQIELTGSHFTPGGRVAVEFSRNELVKKVEVVADEQGTIYYFERDTRNGRSAVTAHDSASGHSANARTEIWAPRMWPASVRID
jgi:hypothetical protein